MMRTIKWAPEPYVVRLRFAEEELLKNHGVRVAVKERWAVDMETTRENPRLAGWGAMDCLP